MPLLALPRRAFRAAGDRADESRCPSRRGLGRWRIAPVLALTITLAAAGLSAVATASASESPRHDAAAHASLFGLGTVNINGTTYGYGDVGKVSSYFVRTGPVNYVLKIASLCRGARAYFLWSPRTGGGVVAWLPTYLSGCLGVAGGGPGGPGGASSPCAQAYTTPTQQDPFRVISQFGITVQPYRVFIAATTGATCRDLSTQVPGGIWARTRVALSGVATGSPLLIKCQQSTPRGVVDYLAPQTSLPGSKSTWWVYDYYVAGNLRFERVPDCYGGSF
jgi:hypothetical protein